ncbi:MAG: hypothetical protein COA79_25645 [Planctomycetota bacterium]|nr:MAG: hypothetical protein COA79_25645 [Planctomycetota bacterium]
MKIKNNNNKELQRIDMLSNQLIGLGVILNLFGGVLFSELFFAGSILIGIYLIFTGVFNYCPLKHYFIRRAEKSLILDVIKTH